MEPDNRILLVEDDQRLATLIRDYLQQQGFEVLIENRGDTAAGRILGEHPDLVVLDLMLPGKDGLAVCQSIRADFHGPILILTAREDDMDQVAGLEMGADDYVKKPVEPRVLLARIRALLRRIDKPALGSMQTAADETADELTFGALRISRTSRSVSLDGRPVDLTTNEFELLWLLARNGGKVIDRDTIYDAWRGIEYDGFDRSADLTISRIRRKLNDNATNPRRIKTIWGQGYLFVKDAW